MIDHLYNTESFGAIVDGHYFGSKIEILLYLKRQGYNEKEAIDYINLLTTPPSGDNSGR